MRHNFRNKSTVATLATVGVLAAVGVGYAANVGGGVLHTCISPGSTPPGRLRVLDTKSGARCGPKENALSLNQTGPRGMPGPAGPEGDSGPQGPRGDGGAPGASGPKGDNGSPGPRGIAGAQGPQGVQGPKGDPGPSTTSFALMASPMKLGRTRPGAQVLSKNLPAGSWAVTATVNLGSGSDVVPEEEAVGCELLGNGNVIGATSDRRAIAANRTVEASLTMNGGVYLPSGGYVVVWCTDYSPSEFPGISATGGQMMMLKVGGFS